MLSVPRCYLLIYSVVLGPNLGPLHARQAFYYSAVSTDPEINFK